MNLVLFRNLLKGLQYMPPVIVTNRLKSYAAARREVSPGYESVLTLRTDPCMTKPIKVEPRRCISWGYGKDAGQTP
jgi:hypothetical protein